MTATTSSCFERTTSFKGVTSLSRSSSTKKRLTSQSGSLGALDPRDDFSLHGQLVVTYANGDVQRLPLQGTVLHPALEVRPPAFDYGRVHVQSPKPLEVTLSNPPLVDAVWSITAMGTKPRVPAAGAPAPAPTGPAAAAAGPPARAATR